MEIFKVENSCKTYAKGEFAAVVGESSSGISTLLNCIGDLDTPISGFVFIDEKNLFSMKEEKRTIFRRRNVGFILQSFQLVSELNMFWVSDGTLTNLGGTANEILS